MIFASGILITNNGDGLFVKRTAVGDHAGEWCIPGGKTEAGESPLDGALRELQEEVGITASPRAALPCMRRVADGVDFTTYRVPAATRPDVMLDGTEHDEYRWASLDDPPTPLHPGVRDLLEQGRAQLDELGVARLIRDGELPSPQRYENVALFDIRVTGTGTAFRKALDEVVYRPPALYLNEEFLARCMALPVVWEHPPKNALDSQEYADRVVGAVMLPYIKGDEVWGIAKIYDNDAIKFMSEDGLSTSPAVIFRDQADGDRVELGEGRHLLIEGKPSLLDHLAICEQGVWDKGGTPAGVTSTATGDKHMDKDEEARMAADSERARADAEAGEKLDKVLSGLDAVGRRFDSMEERLSKIEKGGKADAETAEEFVEQDRGKRDASAETPKEKDAGAADADKMEVEEDRAEDPAKTETNPGAPAQTAADKAKKDADEEGMKLAEKLKEHEESERADAAYRRALKTLESRLPKELSDEDYNAMADAQARADSVAMAFGKSASRPLSGETLLAYRRRLARDFQRHSAPWKDVNLSTLPADAFAIAEGAIYADAQHAAESPVDLPAGELREVKRRDQAGRTISTFYGTGPDTWMSSFKAPSRRLVGINKGA